MDGEIRPIYLYRPSFVVQERSILLTLNSVILNSTQTTTPSPCPLAVGVSFIQSPLRGVLYIIVSRLSNYNKIRLKLAVLLIGTQNQKAYSKCVYLPLRSNQVIVLEK